MNAFRATYTPIELIKKDQDCYYGDNLNNVRTVLVIVILQEFEGIGGSMEPVAVFIDSDGSLKSDWIDRFTNCQTTWSE